MVLWSKFDYHKIQGMNQYKTTQPLRLTEMFPPSEPCTCDICQNYCKRPGWWTVAQAKQAIESGFAHRMMLELAPEMTFGVLSPAFRGNEGGFALQIFSNNGCTFHKQNLCELFGTGLEPLECRFCHHEREGEGLKCHSAIELDWNTREGQYLVNMWYRQMIKTLS